MKKIPIFIPEIETPRLLMVPLAVAHSRLMFDLWSDPEVCRYSGAVSDYEGKPLAMPAASAAVSDRIIDFWERATADGWGFRWAILDRETGSSMGIVGFNGVGPASEIAYHLLPTQWGGGFMFEACEAAIDWRAARGGCTELEAFIEPANGRSIALAGRLGLCATDKMVDGARRYVRQL